MSLKGFHIVFVTVSTLLFVFLALWALDYGWMEGARRYLRDRHAPADTPKAEKHKGDKKAEQTPAENVIVAEDGAA